MGTEQCKNDRWTVRTQGALATVLSAVALPSTPFRNLTPQNPDPAPSSRPQVADTSGHVGWHGTC